VGLIGQVANSYLLLCELDERLALARAMQDSRAESLRIYRRRVDVGSSSRLQLTQVQTLLTQAQALVSQLEQARAAQEQALGLLVGGAPRLPAPPARLGAILPFGQLRPGLPSELLEQRADIRAAEHQIRAAGADLAAAHAAYFPRVTLTSAAGTASSAFGNLFDAGSKAWIFAPAIDLPIFDGGRRRRNVELQEARKSEAIASYEKTIQGAFRDVNDALSARVWLDRQLAISAEALSVQAERARLSALRFDAGSAAFLEVLDAQRDLLLAQQQHVQAQRALLASQVALYSALGGGALARSSGAAAPDAPNQP
jgi:multidrug efflux system outer membrane protein